MGRIEHLTEVDLTQALRCVEYRLPRSAGLKPGGMRLALGIRYGLIGAAAVCHLLSDAEIGEERALLRSSARWPKMVEEHARKDALHRMGLPPEPASAAQVAAWARRTMHAVVAAREGMYPIAETFRDATDLVIAENRRYIFEGWNILARRKADRVFRLACASSVMFAHSFFERRGYGLEEVPEIALLGE